MPNLLTALALPAAARAAPSAAPWSASRSAIGPLADIAPRATERPPQAGGQRLAPGEGFRQMLSRAGSPHADAPRNPAPQHPSGAEHVSPHASPHANAPALANGHAHAKAAAMARAKAAADGPAPTGSVRPGRPGATADSADAAIDGPAATPRALPATPGVEPLPQSRIETPSPPFSAVPMAPPGVAWAGLAAPAVDAAAADADADPSDVSVAANPLFAARVDARTGHAATARSAEWPGIAQAWAPRAAASALGAENASAASASAMAAGRAAASEALASAGASQPSQRSLLQSTAGPDGPALRVEDGHTEYSLLPTGTASKPGPMLGARARAAPPFGEPLAVGAALTPGSAGNSQPVSETTLTAADAALAVGATDIAARGAATAAAGSTAKLASSAVATAPGGLAAPSGPPPAAPSAVPVSPDGRHTANEGDDASVASGTQPTPAASDTGPRADAPVPALRSAPSSRRSAEPRPDNGADASAVRRQPEPAQGMDTPAPGLMAMADAAPTAMPMPVPNVSPPPPHANGPGATGTAPNGAADATPALHESQIRAAINSAEFGPALGLQISTMARDGTQQARLHLNPAEMGPISVTIALDGSGARVDFQADVLATRQALEASLPALAGALRESGLTLTGGSVFQQPQGQPTGADGRPTQAPPQRPGSGPEDGHATAQDRGPRGVTLRRGLVDLVA